MTTIQSALAELRVLYPGGFLLTNDIWFHGHETEARPEWKVWDRKSGKHTPTLPTLSQLMTTVRAMHEMSAVLSECEYAHSTDEPLSPAQTQADNTETETVAQ